MKKYEREIRDLLEKMENFVPENPTPEKERPREREPEREVRRQRPVGVMPPQPIPIRPRRSFFSRFGEWLDAHHVGLSLRLMLGGLGLVIIALIVRQNFGASWTWPAQILAAVGGIVFLMPVLVRFFRGKDIDNGPQYWRGQVVESEHFSWNSLRNWLGGKRNRRNNRNNNPWNDRDRRGRW
jgi:hypothetical protein